MSWRFDITGPIRRAAARAPQLRGRFLSRCGRLTADAFAFDNALAPAGGSKTVPCEGRCGESWFRGEHNGLYQIFLAPLENRNWKAGTYAATLKVTVQVPSQYDFIPAERRGTALVTFDIPPAVNVDR